MDPYRQPNRKTLIGFGYCGISASLTSVERIVYMTGWPRNYEVTRSNNMTEFSMSFTKHCDYCGEEIVREVAQPTNPVSWFQVRLPIQVSMPDRLHNFCRVSCLLQWVAQQLSNENRKASSSEDKQLNNLAIDLLEMAKYAAHHAIHNDIGDGYCLLSYCPLHYPAQRRYRGSLLLEGSKDG